jgi:hypothetical protein
MALSFIECAANGNADRAFKLTNCKNVDLIAVEFSGNVIGVEAVSGNQEIKLSHCRGIGNSSDAVKLTATSDYCKIITSHFAFNGGYGINVADSTCDDNIIGFNSFVTNSSGNLNDAGTNTQVGINTGV